MRFSGDAYFDRNNVMDLRVIGTLGLTEKDVEALKKTEGVEAAEPGYSADMLLNVEGNYKVLHVASVLKDMNKYTVEEGRMPEKSGECFMDGDFLKAHGFQIGDKITLSSGTKDAVTDTLKTDTFEIVGSGSSSMYLLMPEAAVPWETVKSAALSVSFRRILGWRHIRNVMCL